MMKKEKKKKTLWSSIIRYLPPYVPQAQHSSAQPTRTSSRTSTNRCALKTTQEIEISEAYEKIQQFTKQLIWCDTRKGSRVHDYSFSPSFLFRPCIQRPDCCRGPWSSWHFQVASLHLKPWTSLSASFILILFSICERASRRPRSEAPCRFCCVYLPQ